MPEANLTNKAPQAWRKNLYSNVGYEDNYTDVSFLKQLRTNVYSHKISFLDAALGAGRVTERICVIFVFTVIYDSLIRDHITPLTVLVRSNFVALICYLWHLKSTEQFHLGILTAHGRTVFLFIILGFILSPVLKTLTETISTDTIYATTFIMMFVHIVFFDYKVPAAIVSNAISTNAAIFGSLCLASRLQTSFHAFVLLTTSVKCFVLYQSFALSLRQRLSGPILLALVAVTTFTLAICSIHLLISFFILVIFVNVICPYLFVHWQSHKHNIYGPWDEAVITLKNKVD